MASGFLHPAPQDSRRIQWTSVAVSEHPSLVLKRILDVAGAALVVTGVVLVWSVTRRTDLPDKVLTQAPAIIIGIWFGAWGVTLLLQIAFYVMLGIWTRRVIKTRSVGRLDLDFGIRVDRNGAGQSQSLCRPQLAKRWAFPWRTNCLRHRRHRPTGHVLYGHAFGRHLENHQWRRHLVPHLRPGEERR